MRSGTVAVIGRANAGKSTLVNVLVGEKVAIVSPKPQTTRDRILGILNREGRQIVFVDTPGIYRQRNALTGIMMRTTENTSRDVDVILYVHDGHAGVEESDIALMKKYAALATLILAVCKSLLFIISFISQSTAAITDASELTLFLSHSKKYTFLKISLTFGFKTPDGLRSKKLGTSKIASSFW